MKLFTGWVISAALLAAAGAANAQVLAPYEMGRSPYRVVSDIGGPYAAMPPEMPVRGYGPRLLPPEEVYTVLRDGGFSPLGIPRRRGLVYTISVIDRGGDDGRLVIDARTGRILRFLPAMDGYFEDELTISYGLPGPPPPPAVIRGGQRPQHAAPKVASRSVPIPRPAPRAAGEARPLAATIPAVRPAQPAAGRPAQQSVAAAPAKPADPNITGTVGAAVSAAPVAAKPAPQILPTQDMPKPQGLE